MAVENTLISNRGLRYYKNIHTRYTWAKHWEFWKMDK